MSQSDSNSWSELEQLATLAETEEELLWVAELLAEREALQGSGATCSTTVGQRGWIVDTQGDVAEFFGVEVSTVWGWRTGANPMPGDERAWDLKAIARWRCDRLKSLAANAKSAEQIEIELAMLRQDLIKKEIANRLKAKELVSREAVSAKVAEMNNDSRMLIEAIPADLGPLLPPDIRNELTVKITQAITLILRKMAQRAKGCVE